MNAGEFTIEAPKTYASADNARKAVHKAGDGNMRHFIMMTPEGRYFPVFIPNETDMTTTGVHFRWNVVR